MQSRLRTWLHNFYFFPNLPSILNGSGLSFQHVWGSYHKLDLQWVVDDGVSLSLDLTVVNLDIWRDYHLSSWRWPSVHPVKSCIYRLNKAIRSFFSWGFDECGTLRGGVITGLTSDFSSIWYFRDRQPTRHFYITVWKVWNNIINSGDVASP